MRSYWSATIVSVLAHAILIILVTWGWQFSSEPPEIKTPAYIKASLVELKAKAPRKETPKPPQQVEKKVPEEKPDQRKEEQRRIEQEKQAAEQKAQQKKEQQAKEKAAQEARKNQLAKEKAEKEKAEKEKQRKEKAEKEKAAKEKQRKEKQRKEKAKKELQKQAQQEIKRELARQAAQERQAAEEAGIAQSYISLIAARVERAWNRPPSARNGMRVVLKIKLVPTGQVVNVSVSKSSGDDAFDRSAVRAVQKVERFPEIKDMPASVFENNFRELTFIFNPQDLRQ